ncbi:hypothetical protein [Amycolatopsis sp. CA-230715]|uniref:hypothetical protein n=1 Tax=Amycolatopsis sp. CA-230715 TaxID=2745196 RepID=UPI001C011ADA|nr:hypothetical protein [Amycolatopsis sp. CA-230715]QWF82086.1 hypothetical protein HUW46_05523 [Amycolatopsis sp. CA-230715]
MKRLLLVIALAAASQLGLTATASAAPPGGGWEPAPSAPVDYPAGVRCAFASHAEPVVDKVYGKVLKTHPDGSVALEAYAGPLVERFANVENGKSTLADASGFAVVEYHTDGVQVWHVAGPVMVGFQPGHANHAPGVFILDGLYTLKIAPTYRTVESGHWVERDLCAAVS